MGPPLAGLLYEATRSYHISFYLAASCLLVSAVFGLAADLVRRRSRRGEEATQEEAVWQLKKRTPTAWQLKQRRLKKS